MREPTEQTAFRIPTSLRKRLDKHCRRMERAAGRPGVEATRADAFRDLLGRALDLVEAEAREGAES